MESQEMSNYSSSTSVFQLITQLCDKVASDYGPIEDLRILKKNLRSRAFDILFNKAVVPSEPSEPIMDLLTHYYIKNTRKKNIVDFHNIALLKEKIDWLIDRDTSKDGKRFNEVLTCVVSLADSVHTNSGKEMLEDPFSFEKIEALLRQRTVRICEDDPTPYLHFPSQIFEMPFVLSESHLEKKYSSNYDFDGKVFTREPGTISFQIEKFLNIEDDPQSLFSWKNNKSSKFSNNGGVTCYENFPSFPRLTGPREINIPRASTIETSRKVIFTPLNLSYSPIQEIFSLETKPTSVSQDTNLNIWDLASKDTKIHLNIWEEASKLPPVTEKRNLISSSVSNMLHWKQIHMNKMSELNVISEAEFISHLRYLSIGIQSSSFIYDEEIMEFKMNTNLCLEGLLQGYLSSFVGEFLVCGSCFYKLNQLNKTMPLGKDIFQQGCVYQCMRVSLGRYLGWFLLQVEKIFGDEREYLPGLLEISQQIKPLTRQIQAIAKIYNVWCSKTDREYFLRGPSPMAYLYDEVINLTDAPVAAVMYNTLKTTCAVYFRFIERFIFEGELEDHFNDFFIKETKRNIESYNKHYWDKAFKVRHTETIPEFLSGLAKHILLCGKSLRLLKLCNPDDPLCVLLSTDFPPIKCCFTFDEIESQQMLYDQYKMQCLYVCGQPLTFQSMLIQKETDKKAFIEMVSLKQADTMEKLIEERKRLSRIVSQLATAKRLQLNKDNEELAARRKQREAADDLAIIEYTQASDRLHALKLEEDKRRVLSYYTDIGEEVKMRRLRAEWKIKRLKLDDRRVQLLTSEKMSLNREKLEKEHITTVSKILTVQDQDQIKLPIEEEKDVMIVSKDSLDTELDNKESKQSVKDIDASNTPVFQAINLQVTSADTTPVYLLPETPTVQSDTVLHKDVGVLDNADIQSSEIVDEASSIIAAKSVENLLNSDIQASDVVNRNTISNLKIYKSLDSDVSPTDIINSNYHQSTKSVSFSNLDIHESYQSQKMEALRNKKKVMSNEYGVESPTDNLDRNSHWFSNNNRNEANVNRLKSMASEGLMLDNYPQSDVNRKEMPQFDTEASRQALINKQRVLGDEFGIVTEYKASIKRMKQRDNLTLNLKDCTNATSKDWAAGKSSEPRSSHMSVDSTPDVCATTPGEFPLRLDVETPTAMDVDFIGMPSASTLSPTSGKISGSSMPSKHLTDKGFRFPNLLEEEQPDGEMVADNPVAAEKLLDTLTDCGNSLNKYNVKSTVWNFSSDDLSFENFKPCGTERTHNHNFESMDIFNKPITLESEVSPYSNISDIIAITQKKPLTNVFKTISSLQEDDSVLQKLDNVDFSTMATCIRRSVMIPLSCQMEMVNNATLKYFLVNCDIYDHFKSLHDYFFLMDGEFAKTICKNLFEKLNVTESPRELLNFATLHSILDKSFGSSVGGTHKYAENLSFIVNEMPLSFYHSSPDVLECLTLSYTATWPVNIIISQEAVDRYGKVFQFLVKMRRISWALEKDSESLKMSLKEEFMISREIQRSPQYHSVQIFRYKMSSLIRALHSYVLTTCLQSSWKEFEKDLVSVKTIDEMYSTHVGYLKKVLFRCFLNKRSIPMMKLLNNIFAVVLRFHHFLNARCWHIAENEVHYTHPLFVNMKKLSGIFEKMAKNLCKTATRLSECGYQPHLIELVTIINMNGYYNN